MFKYVNPGYGDLLDNQGATKYSTEYNPTNGVAFTGGDGKSITFPAGVKEVWIKCRMYRSVISGVISVSGTNRYTGVALNKNNGTGNAGLYLNDGSWGKGYKNKYYSEVELEIVLHIKSSKYDGLVELWINGDYIGIRQGNCNNGNDLEGVWFYPENNNDTEANYFCNIIVADYDISREEVIEAKLLDPTGDWKGLEIGQAEATAVGQTITQKIDTDDLKARVEAKSKTIDISSVSLAAVGTKFDSSVVNALTGVIGGGTADEYTNTQKIINSGAAVLGTYVKDYTLDKLKTTNFKLVAVKV